MSFLLKLNKKTDKRIVGIINEAETLETACETSGVQGRKNPDKPEETIFSLALPFGNAVNVSFEEIDREQETPIIVNEISCPLEAMEYVLTMMR